MTNTIVAERDENRILKGAAVLISWLLHPILIPLYAIALLLYVHPSAFAGFSMLQKKQVMMIIGLNIVIFPLITVLLLRAVGFISSIYMLTTKDRIIPYIACGIFFFWAFTVFRQQPQYPLLLVSFLFGIFLASSLALIANIYFKISMHAIGMGGISAFIFMLAFTGSMLMIWPVALVIFLSGVVCSARLIVSDHSYRDIIGGLVVGAVSQIIAALYLL